MVTEEQILLFFFFFCFLRFRLEILGKRKKKSKVLLKMVSQTKINEVINLTTHKTFDAFKHYLQKNKT